MLHKLATRKAGKTCNFLFLRKGLALNAKSD